MTPHAANIYYTYTHTHARTTYRRFRSPSNRVVRIVRVCVLVDSGKFKFTTTMSAEPGRKTPYSRDIGWRVIWQRIGMERGFRDIASNLQISLSTAHRIFKRFEDTGDVTVSKQQSRPYHRKLDDLHELFIIGIVMENPCIYLTEICQAIYEATGVKVSSSLVCRTLQRNGFSRKKASQVAKQRYIQYRAVFLSQVMAFNLKYFVWLDETGSDARNHIRKFGYALRGMTPEYHRVLSRGQRMSAIAAISSAGLVCVDLTKETVTGAKFLDFVRGTLIPEMEPFDGSEKRSIVIMDNCSVHHTTEVKQSFEDAGIMVIYLPPYSPDLNPIEEAFSYIKYYLKEHDEVLQLVRNPINVLQAAFNSITSEKCKGWIAHCGYC